MEIIKTKYENSKIYKIISPIAGDKPYFGSTIQALTKRKTGHVTKYKAWKNGASNKTTSFDLFEEHGYENCKIILVELFPCNTKEQLLAREQFYIDTVDCINKHDAKKPQDTIEEYQKQYRNDHAETIKQRKAVLYQENKDEVLQKHKAYYNEHKAEINEKNTIYRNNHKEEIKEYKKEYYSNAENKTHKNEMDKKYREENKEDIALGKKEWYEANKARLSVERKLRYEAKKDLTYQCDVCECEVKCANKLRHSKSKMHISNNKL